MADEGGRELCQLARFVCFLAESQRAIRRWLDLPFEAHKKRNPVYKFMHISSGAKKERNEKKEKNALKVSEAPRPAFLRLALCDEVKVESGFGCLIKVAPMVACANLAR